MTLTLLQTWTLGRSTTGSVFMELVIGVAFNHRGTIDDFSTSCQEEGVRMADKLFFGLLD